MDQPTEKVNSGTSTDMITKSVLYTWGLGKSGQLGTGQENTEHTPQEIRLPRTKKGSSVFVKQVSCGGLYTAVLTEEGDVFMSGCGKYGRLATGNEDNKTSLVKVTMPEDVDKISSGSWHGAAVTTSRHLIVWGHRKGCGLSPDSSGDAKQTPTIVTLPAILSLPEELRVVGVACGHNYTIAWTSSGVVMSWGSGHHGVLGHSSTDDVSSPRIIAALKDEKIVEGSAGYSHSAFLTSEGRVYVCGKGKDGALGLGERQLSDVSTPTHVAFPGIKFIVQVSCSVGEHHGHTLALTDEGRVFSWGDGYKGKLGLGHQESKYTPTLIPPPHFSMESVSVVCAGGIHSAAATAGSVYTWGCGSDGRLGHPEGQGHRYLFRTDVPKRVEGLGENGKRGLVACSYYHTAAVIQQ